MDETTKEITTYDNELEKLIQKLRSYLLNLISAEGASMKRRTINEKMMAFRQLATSIYQSQISINKLKKRK